MGISLRHDRMQRAVTADLPIDRWLLLISIAGVFVRAATTYFLPSVVWADETLQYVEQASRLLGGHALIPWEYQVGARSWALPILILPAVALGRALSPSPDTVYGCVAAFMTVQAIASTVAAYTIGRHVGSRLHGVLAAFLVTFWSETIYFSPHILADTVAATLLMISVAVSMKASSDRQLLVAGGLLGCTFVVRLQLAPALALIGLFACHRDLLRRGVILTAGFLAPVLAAGLLDWATWGAPFRSFYVYFLANQAGVASSFGVASNDFFLAYSAATWSFAAPLILVTALLARRRALMLLATIVIIVATFSLVPHKEYRFIYPAILLLMTVCGIGSAELVYDLSRMTKRSISLTTAVVLLAWSSASLASALSPAMRPMWLRDRPVLTGIAVVNSNPASCGVAIAPNFAWASTGASRFRSDLSLFEYSPRTAAAYNYVLSFKPSVADPPPAPSAPFTLLGCYGGWGPCIYKRQGTCDATQGRPLKADPPPATLAVLHQLGLL